MVKRYLSFILALLLLFIVAIYINRVSPDDNKINQQGKNGTVSDEYPNFGGPNDVKLELVDEAGENASLTRFRDELLVSVKRKDLVFLKEHINKNIKYSFGENDGRKGFLREWGFDTNPNESRFWDELREVLTLGGTFNEGKTIFTAPYIFTEFPEKIDAFQHVAIIDKNVKVYSEPDLDSKIIGKLDYSIVRVLDRNVNSSNTKGVSNGWLKVENFSGEAGFVLAKYTRSPIDYRASFQNIGGAWEMMFFVAGD